MANIKNFGLNGIASEVQLGKAGPKLKADSGHIEARAATGELTTMKAAAGIANDDVATVSQLSSAVSAVDGTAIPLGTAPDGSYTPGAVSFTSTMKVTDAVDALNEVLAKLIPSQPPQFPNGALSVSNTAGTNPLLASGVTDNTVGGSSGYSAGSAVSRITAAGVNSNTFTNVGPGDSGTVQLLVNNAVAGSRALTGSGDNGTYSGLVIAGQADYPSNTPGFWKSINVSVSAAAVSAGINRFKLNHTGAGSTSDVYFVRDTMTSLPVLSLGSVAQNAAGTLAYSSSVPHYGAGASLTVGTSISNLAGETYYNGTPLAITGTNSIIASQSFSYATCGITTPIARNTIAATAITPVTVNVNGTNVFAQGTIQGVATNVNGSSSINNIAATNILVMIGTQAGKIYELSVPVSNLGATPNSNNAVRVLTGSGDTPAAAQAAFSSSAALDAYEAAVVAGVLKHDQTNYTTYLPAGPDFSTGRSGAQYVTFAFQRASVSKFTISVTGNYAGCWVKLPGVSDNGSISPTGAAANGWWNMYQPYDGAGVPGESGDATTGCALGTTMSGNGGNFVATFGTQTSTNSTSNYILVRFKLNAGQSITALSFTN